MPADTTAAVPKTKEQILQEFRIQTIQDAAARVIASKGLNGATMQAIADAAGIAKGTRRRTWGCGWPTWRRP